MIAPFRATLHHHDMLCNSVEKGEISGGRGTASLKGGIISDQGLTKKHPKQVFYKLNSLVPISGLWI